MERRRQDLDFFVLYSSTTSIFGNRGQTSYSAANDFMNSFAKYRRHVCGRPCLSVCWGAMGGAGMLDRNATVALILESAGFYKLDIDQGNIRMLDITVLTIYLGSSSSNSYSSKSVYSNASLSASRNVLEKY